MMIHVFLLLLTQVLVDGQNNQPGSSSRIVAVGEWAPVSSFDPATGSFNIKPSAPSAPTSFDPAAGALNYNHRNNEPKPGPFASSLTSTFTSLDLTPVVRFALGIMILVVILSVVLDIGGKLFARAGPMMDTLSAMVPSGSGRAISSGLLEMLARQAFTAIDKYDLLDSEDGFDHQGIQRSQPSAGQNGLRKQPASSNGLGASMLKGIVSSLAGGSNGGLLQGLASLVGPTVGGRNDLVGDIKSIAKPVNQMSKVGLNITNTLMKFLNFQKNLDRKKNN